KPSRHSTSAIIRRAAATADNDFAPTTLRRIQKHLTDAKRARAKWIALIFADSPHACRLAHLHHRQFLIVNERVAHFDFATERIVRAAFHPRTAKRAANHL